MTILNINTTEINKFNKLAKTWWDPNGPMAMLHILNPLRTQFITQNVEIFGQKILDVGCGAGLLTESLSKAGGLVTGLDLTARTLAVAREHAQREQLTIDYFEEEVEIFAENHNETFDVVTCLEVLEHVPDPQKIIKACASLLKPGGYLFVSTLNRNFKSYLCAIIGAEYILKLLPKGTHSYKHFIKPKELESMAQLNGFCEVTTASFMYNPLRRTFKLVNSTDTNYIVCFRLI